MLASITALNWPEILGILSSLASGSGAVIVMVVAVRKAKRETRAQADRECLDRIERMRLRQVSGAPPEADE
jgi:hypothetical protein